MILRHSPSLSSANPSRWAGIVMIGHLALAGTGVAQESGIVPLGKGSYSLKRPESCKPLPETIYRTEKLTGSISTNQWWSSLIWKRFSQPLFAHPLTMLCHSGGLAVTYPGDVISGESGNIIGGGIAADGDFYIGHSKVERFPDARCSAYSDWFVTARFAQDDAILETSIGHGSPYVFGRIAGGSPQIHFGAKPQIWADDGATLGVTVKGRHYGIFGPSGSSWEGRESSVFTNRSEKSHFSIALLPDKDEKTLAHFERYAHNHVTGTRAVPGIKGGKLKTSYRFETTAMEGSGSGTVFALYPHQWKYSSTELSEMDYASVRGLMKVGTGSEFTTTVPIQGLLPMLPAEGIPDKERMRAYLMKAASIHTSEYKDTYWEGKHLGMLTTLSGIAEVMDEPVLRKRFVSEIRKRLENWFTASPGEEFPLFYYKRNWGSLIGSKPSYGSDDQLNDHHFHYGYFIRAAAEVARLDREWAEDWGPMVELLIREIASPSYDDPLFPHIRCFDTYAGHSWASGHADFGDGNNQESSSESMNAWYGLMLWGEATGNKAIRDTGIYLFNTERTAVEEYWFDVSETNFPKNFPHVALGMVWGGKGAFATWFSGDIDCIHGINWLPFTPASIYMGRFPGYVRKNHDRIVEERPEGKDYNNGWGDLVVMFNALSDPASAAAYIDGNPDCSLEGGNTHAFMYHWIHTLDRLGLNDASVTADHPFVNVYSKGDRRTYVAYNHGDKPLNVSFSDGTSMVAEPGGLTLKR